MGGVFFRARDPEALARWYADALGVELTDYSGVMFQAEAGDVTIWSPFAADTEYFGRLEQQAMVNYRVDDLDGVLARLRELGAEVDDKVQDEPYGRFGWASDPEGNRFELWQPR